MSGAVRYTPTSDLVCGYWVLCSPRVLFSFSQSSNIIIQQAQVTKSLFSIRSTAHGAAQQCGGSVQWLLFIIRIPFLLEQSTRGGKDGRMEGAWQDGEMSG